MVLDDEGDGSIRLRPGQARDQLIEFAELTLLLLLLLLPGGVGRSGQQGNERDGQEA